jgi:riboflavin synthase
MFTGIITAIGTVEAIDQLAHAHRLVVRSCYLSETIMIGASISHDGCCLTVADKGTDERGNWHSVDVSPHTLAHTTLGTWGVGRRVNLERALRAGDELGGHLVTGHVDGLATMTERVQEADSVHYTMHAPNALSLYLANKGSVTLDGVSLTVTWVRGEMFGLTLIPHTLAVTTWGEKQVGDAFNMEVDVIARYVRRMVACNVSQ